jgi:tape measure domain-containing protein
MAIQIETRSDSRAARSDLAKLRQSVGNIETSVNNTVKGFDTLAKSIAAVATAAVAFKQFTVHADTFQNLKNRLISVTDGTKQFNEALKNVKKTAVSTRTDLNATANLYSKVALAGKRFAIQQKQIAAFTATVQKTLAISGATAAETQSAILQLGQGLAANRFAGEELRAVFEAAPVFALNLAKGMEVPFGKLRKLAEEGKLTFSTIFNAILKQQKDIDDQFRKLGITYAQAFTNLGNAFNVLFFNIKGELFGTGKGLADVINNMALALFDVAESISHHLLNIKISLKLFLLDFYYKFQQLGEFLALPFAIFFKAFERVSDKIKTVTSQIYTFASSLFNNVITNIPRISVRDVFPDLETALGMIHKFVAQAERAFYWLYDKVIGNSWIPDLVLGIIDWVKKLLAKPLSYITTFVSEANLLFTFLLSRITLLFSAKIFKTPLLALNGILALLGGIGVAITGAVAGIKDARDLVGEPIDDNFLSKFKYYAEAAFIGIKALVIRLKDAIQRDLAAAFNATVEFFKDGPSKIIDRIKTVFGTAFSYVKTKVSEIKGSLSNFKIKVTTQIEGLKENLTSILVGAASFAFFAASISEKFRTGLIGTIVAVFGFAAAAGFSSDSVADSILGLARKFASAIVDFFKNFAIENPLGLASILLSLSLLFESGREFFGNVIKQFALLPAKTGVVGYQAVEKWALDKRIDSLKAQIKNQTKYSEKTLEIAKRSYNKEFKNLLGRKGISGQRITTAQIEEALKGHRGDFDTLGVRNRKAFTKLLDASNTLDQAARRFEKEGKGIEGLNKKLEPLLKHQSRLEEVFTERRERFKAGVSQIGGTVGGVFGAAYGYELGGQIAETLTGSPEWVKVGVSMAGGMIGMGIGGAIGATIANVVRILLEGAVKLIVATMVKGFVRPLLAGILSKNAWVQVATILGLAVASAGAVIATEIASVFTNDRRLEADLKRGKKNLEYAITPEQMNQSVDRIAVNLEALRLSAEKREREIPAFTDNPLGWIKDSLVELFGTDPLEEAFTIRSKLDQENQEKVLKAATGFTEEQIRNFEDTSASLHVMWESLKHAIKSQFGGSSDHIQNRASGGFVYGPGSGTSDDIPAMLSNGEFVVNAKDASRNRNLLRLINSGFKVPGFRQGIDLSGGTSKVTLGTGPDGSKSNPLHVSIEEDNGLISKFADNFMGAIDSVLGSEIGKEVGNLVGGIKGYFSGDPNSITKRYSEIKGYEESLKLIANSLKDIKQPISIKELKQATPTELNNLVRSLESLRRINNELVTLPEGLKKTFELESDRDALRKDIQSIVKGISGDPSGAGGIGIKSQDAKLLKEQFEDITESFPDLNISLAEFYNMVPSLRTEMAKSAGIFADGMAALEDLNSSDATDVGKTFRQLKADRDNVQKLFQEDLESFRTNFSHLSKTLSDFGISFDKDTFDVMSSSEKEKLRSAIEFMQIQYTLLSETPDDTTITKIRKAIRKGEEAIKELFDTITGATETAAEKAGSSFTNTVNNSLKGSINSLIKSEITTTDFLEQVLDNFTNSVLDTFVDGLMDPFTREGGFLDNLAKDLGAAIFGFGTNVATQNDKQPGSKIDDLVSATTETTIAVQEGTQQESSLFSALGNILLEGFKSFGDLILQGINGLSTLFSGGSSGGGFLNSIGDFVSSIFSFAEGGMVIGPGTGTSDSIMARLSNGEFVVNAQATKENYKLLTAINSGKLPKFATGGLVSSSMINSPNRKPASNQTIQIHITGDVSRQTRKEVLKMIPEIANMTQNNFKERRVI